MAELPPAKPLAYHGMNWNAQALAQDGDGFVFRALPGQLRLARLISGVGYAILCVAVVLLMHDVSMALFTLVVGGLFLLAHRWFAMTGVEGVRVEPRSRTLRLPGSRRKASRILDFREIQAVQYLPYRKHASFIVFAELNLILCNRERLSLVHHNDLRRIRADGERLASLLGVRFDAHAVWALK